MNGSKDKQQIIILLLCKHSSFWRTSFPVSGVFIHRVILLSWAGLIVIVYGHVYNYSTCHLMRFLAFKFYEKRLRSGLGYGPYRPGSLRRPGKSACRLWGGDGTGTPPHYRPSRRLRNFVCRPYGFLRCLVLVSSASRPTGLIGQVLNAPLFPSVLIYWTPTIPKPDTAHEHANFLKFPSNKK